MQRKDTKQQGFSLIELAILLMVIGIVVTPMIVTYNNTIAQTRMNETRSSFADVKSAINLYIAANGRYPRPASLSAVEGDANFGQEVAFTATPPPCAAVASWLVPDGYCATTGGETVLIGAVPFDILGLDPQAAEDYWNNKIIYAVSTSQTVAGTFSQAMTAGSITVRSFDSNLDIATGEWSRLPDADFTSTYDMVLVSTGETAIGGFSNQGGLIEACANIPPPFATNESENCDFDTTFFLDTHPVPSKKFTGARSGAQGTAYYDDITDAQDAFPLTTWFENSFDPAYVMTISDRIGIGTNEPDARVDVIGNIQAGEDVIGNERNIETTSLCDGTNLCFEPELVGGNRPEMDCNENALAGSEPVIEIGDGQVYCGAAKNAGATEAASTEIDGSTRGFEFPAPTFSGTRCVNTGELMTGINAGVVQCATP